jgi:carboxymethylenebutenolidase
LPTKAPAPLAVADRIHGPILGFWGDQDAGAGMENVERLAAALQARRVDFDYTIYPGLGHGFMAASQLDPNHEAYQAACESWTKTIEFYRRHLEEAG